MDKNLPNLIIREANADDAASILDYMRQVLTEPDLDIPLTPEEFTYTIEQERDFLEAFAKTDNSVFLLATLEDQIVGQLSLIAGSREALKHSVELGITVHRDYRFQGIGGRLIEHALAWARQSGRIHRIWLRVYARNRPAIHLYEKYGFQQEGRNRHAIFQGGEYLDDLVMALLLDDKT